MLVRIHFTWDTGIEDSFTVQASCIEDIREVVKECLLKRGLDAEKNNCWSEVLKTS